MMHQEMLKEFKGRGGRGRIPNVVQINQLLSAQAQKMPCKELMSCIATT